MRRTAFTSGGLDVSHNQYVPKCITRNGNKALFIEPVVLNSQGESIV